MSWRRNGHDFCLYTLCDSNGMLLTHVLGTAERQNSAELQRLSVLGWQLFEFARGDVVSDYVRNFSHGLALCGELWTCDCRTDFIRHQELLFCPFCGACQDRGRLPGLADWLHAHEDASRSGTY